MVRLLFFLAAALAISVSGVGYAHMDEGPVISITSPNTATTFAYATLKNHSLSWNAKRETLFVHVVFTDASGDSGQANDDSHEFPLPGVTFDEAKGIFFATSVKGELIPVARLRKSLFLKQVETTPNAIVRIIHPNGEITVVLEAIRPDDPSLHTPAGTNPPSTNPDGTHSMDLDKILH